MSTQPGPANPAIPLSKALAPIMHEASAEPGVKVKSGL
jgi:hypothetical protein